LNEFDVSDKDLNLVFKNSRFFSKGNARGAIMRSRGKFRPKRGTE